MNVQVIEKKSNAIRSDFQRILDIIPQHSSVLDLGCGDGDLMFYLKHKKGVKCCGVERSVEGVKACIEKGISVFQGDILDGLMDYDDKAFDFVILSQTLHELSDPDAIIREMLRVGKKIIISFFNLAHFGYRLEFLLKGKFPSKFPYSWKNTYASLLTLKDFKIYCHENGINIIQEIYLGPKGKEIGKCLSNSRAQVVLLVLNK
ncbi:MAG: methionine biosynthesis protein MetW [Promethearchaeota archaeon]